MPTPTLLIIRGLPGAGKTTIAKALVEAGLFPTYVEADHYMLDEEGNYDFCPENLEYCHRKCQNHVEEYLRSGRSIIVSNTSLTHKEVETYRKIAALHHANVQIMELKSPFKSIHNVPSASLVAMAGKWENLV